MSVMLKTNPALLAVTIVSFVGITPSRATADQVLLAGLKHLRSGDSQEWSSFPKVGEDRELNITFAAKANTAEWTLSLRHQDLKSQWEVSLNDKSLGRLLRDENDMLVYLDLPAGALKDGENSLRIAAKGKGSDDIRVGEIRVIESSVQSVTSAAKLAVTVRDVDSGKLVPCRITVLNSRGAMQSVGAQSNDHMAVRPGTIYCLGRAEFGMPSGDFKIFAGRGFEWSVDSKSLAIKPGETHNIQLSIRREVDTAGYVACDTHVHTLTFSGHGDATITERMLTLAGEGIELPIATDHNIHIDYENFAPKLGVRDHFTPVIGNEFTTKIGHFNIFPIKPGSKVPDHRAAEWPMLFDNIFKTPGVKVAILNHARDLHGGYRPFGPKHHLALVGRNLDGWTLKANAMEVVNSGAQQTDVLQLFHDWMGHLNAGRHLTAVGSSDSHDVSRHFVGQGRTYVRTDDADPGKINVGEVVEAFTHGRVLVSCGLLVTLEVNKQFREGDLVPKSSDYSAVIKVSAPSWSRADRVQLFANGISILDERIKPTDARGLKWTKQIALPKWKYDVHLAAIATGPGVQDLFWASAKAYQPTSTDPSTRVVAGSGAVWIDADGNGRRNSALDYAREIMTQTKGNLDKVFANLAKHDASVVAQVADLLVQQGTTPNTAAVTSRLKSSTQTVRDAWARYREAWTESVRARAGQ